MRGGAFVPGSTGRIAVCVLALVSAAALAQDSGRKDWLRNPSMGNYKAYAEFKMAHYEAARQVWMSRAAAQNHPAARAALAGRGGAAPDF